jgi:hypothetical protein
MTICHHRVIQLNRTLLLAGAAIVVAGIVAAFILAGGLSPNANLSGALYDDAPGPWLYAPGAVISTDAIGPDTAQGSPAAFVVLEQRHEQLAVGAGGTVGTDCYLVAPVYWTGAFFATPDSRRADMLVLAGAVEAAPGVVKATGIPSGCPPAPAGVLPVTRDVALVGKALMRSEALPFTCGSDVYTTLVQTGTWYVTGITNVETPSGAVTCCAVRPGYRDYYGYWRFWDEKTLYAPMAYVRANYHPVPAVDPAVSPTPVPSYFV